MSEQPANYDFLFLSSCQRIAEITLKEDLGAEFMGAGKEKGGERGDLWMVVDVESWPFIDEIMESTKNKIKVLDGSGNIVQAWKYEEE